MVMKRLNELSVYVVVGMYLCRKKENDGGEKMPLPERSLYKI